MNSEKQSTNLQMTLREVNRVGEVKKNIPKLRFKGYEDAWEQRKLGEVGITYTGLSGKTKEDFGHGNGQFVTYMNVFSNAVASSEMVEPVEIDERQNKVVAGDVLFTTSSETPEEVGMSSVWLENSKNTYLNSFCFGYRPLIPFDPYYLAFMLRSSLMRKKITFLAQGISRYNISKNKMMDIEIPVPIMSEQHQIGEYFRNLDYLITLHQRKYDALKSMKKTLLSKMFPKNGQDVPEIRFKGFTDAWEQRKFMECINNVVDYRGKTPKKLGMNWSEEGFLALSALNVKDGYIDFELDANYGDIELYSAWMKQDLSKGQVVFTTEAPMGNVAQIPDKSKYILSQRVIAFEVAYEKITDDFLATLLKSPKVFDDLTSLATGGTAKGVSQKSLSKLSVKIPQIIEEQNKIAKIICTLNKAITLHQRKLEELKNMKKTLLQQMFV